MKITDYIPKGKENAVTRTELVIRTGICDRKVRQEIENARAGGAIICNDQDGKDTPLRDCLRKNGNRSSPVSMPNIWAQDKHRALSILWRQKTMRKTLKEAGYTV